MRTGVFHQQALPLARFDRTTFDMTRMVVHSNDLIAGVCNCSITLQVQERQESAGVVDIVLAGSGAG